MKKILMLILLIISANTLLYSNEKISDKTLFQDASSDKNDSETSATIPDNQSKNLFRVNIAHGVIGAVGFADMIALSIVGQIMLNKAWGTTGETEGENEEEDDEDSVTSASASADSTTGASSGIYESLRIAHIVLASTTYLFLGSSLLMAYITMGIKIQKNMPVNFPHFVSSIITSSFYIVDLILMIITGVAYYMHASYANNIGLVHGIVSYTLLASYTVTLITLPIGWNNRKLLKKI